MRLTNAVGGRGGIPIAYIPFAVVTTLCLLVSPSDGQTPRDEGLDLPSVVVEQALEFLNHPSTIRFTGLSSVPDGARVIGNVGVLGGPFTIDGTIEGDLVVLNATITFGDNGRVTGDVTVIGGRAADTGDNTVGGSLEVYQRGIAVTERDGVIVERRLGSQDPPGVRFGASRLTIRTEGAYNRVEGLPVLFGPTFEVGDANPFRAEALVRWRTESGFQLEEEELGYRVRAEQTVGSAIRAAFGASVYRDVQAISDWGLSNVETSLAAFLFHRDYRDYYAREGWSAFTRLEPNLVPLTLSLTFRDERHAFAPVSSPWTLSRNDDEWRAQPLVSEGDLQTLTVEAVYDTRNDRDNPSDGWLANGRIIRGVGGNVQRPQVSLEDQVVGAERLEENFTAGFADVRRYNRITPSTQISFRALYGGTIIGDPLPSQYQQALGGEGSLPGAELFSLDCGARDQTFEIERSAFDSDSGMSQPVFDRFGCDRAFLFQVEFRSDFAISLDLRPDRDNEWNEGFSWYPLVDLTPAWTAFLNSGQGWSESDGGLDTGSFTDVGLGLVLGDLGVYWAYPLDGDDRDVNFFVRLSRRF